MEFLNAEVNLPKTIGSQKIRPRFVGILAAVILFFCGVVIGRTTQSTSTLFQRERDAARHVMQSSDQMVQAAAKTFKKMRILMPLIASYLILNIGANLTTITTKDGGGLYALLTALGVVLLIFIVYFWTSSEADQVDEVKRTESTKSSSRRHTKKTRTSTRKHA